MTIGLGFLLGFVLIIGLAIAGWCFYEEGWKLG